MIRLIFTLFFFLAISLSCSNELGVQKDNQFTEQVQELETKQEGLVNAVVETKAELNAVKGDVSAVKGDVTAFKTEVNQKIDTVKNNNVGTFSGGGVYLTTALIAIVAMGPIAVIIIIYMILKIRKGNAFVEVMKGTLLNLDRSEVDKVRTAMSEAAVKNGKVWMKEDPQFIDMFDGN